MIHARMMYLRPGNLMKEFSIARKSMDTTPSGRPTELYENTGSILKGCLCESDPETVKQYGRPEHPVTHTIIQSGATMAKEGDRLFLDSRVFDVQNVSDAGALGVSTIYYVEERRDLT